MTQILYVVMGRTGEYSDREEWPVLAFFNHAAAQDYVEKASGRARELESTRAGPYTPPPGVNEYDREMRMDYTGTSYYLLEVLTADDEEAASGAAHEAAHDAQGSHTFLA